MESNSDLLKMKNGMTLTEFGKVLDSSVLDTKQKNKLLSIFNQLSNNDGIMNAEEWNGFIGNLDKNKNEDISNSEWNAAVNKKTGFLKGLNLSDLKILYSIVLKYINSESGDKISKKVMEQLEEQNLGNEIETINNNENGDVIVTFKNNSTSPALRQYDKNGNLLFEIRKNDKGAITDLVEYKDNKPLISKTYSHDHINTTLYDTEGNIIKKENQVRTYYKNPYNTMASGYNNTKAKLKEIEKTILSNNSGFGVLSGEYYDRSIVKQALKEGITFAELEIYYTSERLMEIISGDNALTTEYYLSILKEDLSQYDREKYGYLDNVGSIVNKTHNRDTAAKVFYAPPNRYRAKNTAGKGTFDGNWLQRDSYNSQTFSEWLTNNQYEFDTETAEVLNKKAKRRNSGNGQCAEKTRLVFNDTIPSWNAQNKRYSPTPVVNDKTQDYNDSAIEFTDDDMYAIAQGTNLMNGMQPQGSAYKYASELANNPYFREVPHNIVATMNLKSLPKGCVIVYDANYKTSYNAQDYEHRYHIHGHIAITDGTGRDSGDGLYSIVDNKQATHIRVFVPVKPKLA